MSPYDHTTVNLVIIISCAGAAAILLALLWYRVVSPDSFDRDTARFLVKMFGAITIGMLLLMMLIRYT